MGKVICFYTRKEITQMPANKAEGEALILNLLNFELTRQDNPLIPDSELISNVITMIENNTGASRYELMERIYLERKA